MNRELNEFSRTTLWLASVLCCMLFFLAAGCSLNKPVPDSNQLSELNPDHEKSTETGQSPDVSTMIYHAILQTEYLANADVVTAEYVALLEAALQYSYDPIVFETETVDVVPFESYIDFSVVDASFSLRLSDPDGYHIILSITDPLHSDSNATVSYDGAAKYPKLEAVPPYDSFPLFRRCSSEQTGSFDVYSEQYFSEYDLRQIEQALAGAAETVQEPRKEANHYYQILLRELFRNEISKSDFLDVELIPRPTRIHTVYAILGVSFALRVVDTFGNEIILYKSQSGNRPEFVTVIYNNAVISYYISHY